MDSYGERDDWALWEDEAGWSAGDAEQFYKDMLDSYSENLRRMGDED